MKKQNLMLVIAIGFGLAACSPDKPKHKDGYTDAETSGERIEAVKKKLEADKLTAEKEKRSKEVQEELGKIETAREEKARAEKAQPEKPEPAPAPAPAPAPVVTPVVEPKVEPKAEPKKEEPKQEAAQPPKKEIKSDTPTAPVPELEEDAPVVETGGDDEAPVVESGSEKPAPAKEEPKKEESKADIVDPKAKVVAIKLGEGNSATKVAVDCQDKVPGTAPVLKGIVLLSGSRALLAGANDKNEDVTKSASCLEDKKLDLEKDLANTKHKILGRGETKSLNAKMLESKDGKLQPVTNLTIEVKCVADASEAKNLRGIALLPGSALSLDTIIKEKAEDVGAEGAAILGCK